MDNFFEVIIKVNRINEPIQQNTLVKRLEDQMLKLSLLEKIDTKIALTNANLVDENKSLKDRCVSLMNEININKDQCNQKMDKTEKENQLKLDKIRIDFLSRFYPFFGYTDL